MRQHPELEFAEERSHPLPVEVLDPARFQLERDVEVGPDCHQVEIPECGLPSVDQFLLERPADQLDVVVDLRHTAELPDQVGRRLLADPADPLDVVARVTLQRLVVDHVRRAEAVPLGRPLLVVVDRVALVRTEHEHVHVRPDELHQVRVERRDVGFDSLGRGPLRDRPRHIVGFVTGRLEHGDAERVEQLPHALHLPQQLRRRLPPGGLVRLARFMPEGLPVGVPGCADVRRLEQVEDPDQRLRVAVHGEGEFALRGHQRMVGVREREERAVQDTVRVEHDEARLPAGCWWHRPIIDRGDRATVRLRVPVV